MGWKGLGSVGLPFLTKVRKLAVPGEEQRSYTGLTTRERQLRGEPPQYDLGPRLPLREIGNACAML